MEAILLTGIQATGKSTFYKQYFADTHLRINLDMLKTRHRENLIFQACLEAKQPFVIDNTNPTQPQKIAKNISPWQNRLDLKLLAIIFNLNSKTLCDGIRLALGKPAFLNLELDRLTLNYKFLIFPKGSISFSNSTVLGRFYDSKNFHSVSTQLIK